MLIGFAANPRARSSRSDVVLIGIAADWHKLHITSARPRITK
jgi:hypothetical protein